MTQPTQAQIEAARKAFCHATGLPPAHDGAWVAALAAAAEAGETHQPTDNDMRGLSASNVACYKWPEDTREHKSLRAAYVEGAADYDSATIERCAMVAKQFVEECGLESEALVAAIRALAKP